MKRILALLLLLATALSLTSCAIRQRKTEDEGEYEEYLGRVEYADVYMPPLALCGEYSAFCATYKYRFVVMFETYTVGLFLSYGEDEYEAQKAAVLSRYEFFDAEDETLVSDPDATAEGYHFRLVKQDYPLETYKVGLLIGTDDADRRICYLYYYDCDLDVLNNLDVYIREHAYLP